MRDYTKMTNTKVKESIVGKMEMYTKVILERASKKVWEYFTMLMEISTWGSLRVLFMMDMACT